MDAKFQLFQDIGNIMDSSVQKDPFRKGSLERLYKLHDVIISVTITVNLYIQLA